MRLAGVNSVLLFNWVLVEGGVINSSICKDNYKIPYYNNNGLYNWYNIVDITIDKFCNSKINK